jgi:hypothetical protein
MIAEPARPGLDASFSVTRPAVMVGIGPIGRRACELLRAHRRLRRVFGSDQLDQDEPDRDEPGIAYCPIADTVPPDASAVAIRQEFLEHDLVSVTMEIVGAFDNVRQHRWQPLATYVEPVIFVVGATNEAAGCALLWLLGQLIRRAVGSYEQYRLIGVFLSANAQGSFEARARDDAHTFVTLSEGDALLHGPPSWDGDLERHFPLGTVGPSRPFDQIYLIDGLKENNATADLASGDLDEIIQHAAVVLEALALAPIPREVDNLLLDDYGPTVQQTYIGVGASALAVPLETIDTLLQNRTAGTLIRDRLLNPDLAPPVTSRAGELTTLLISALGRSSEDMLRSVGRGLATTGLALTDSDDVLRVEFSTRSSSDAPVPSVHDVRIDAPAPGSGERSLDVTTVIDHFHAEIEAREDARRRVARALREQRESSVERAFRQVQQAVATMLHGGDGGLLQAIDLLESVAPRLRVTANRLANERRQLDDDRRLFVLQDSVEGRGRWFYDLKWLQPIVEHKPRLPAIVMRALLLTILVAQFYWDGEIRGVRFWPFDRLVPWLLGADLTGDWRPLLVLVVALPILLGITFLTAIPALLLSLAIRTHRRLLVALLSWELRREVLADAHATYSQLAHRVDDLLRSYNDRRSDLKYEQERLLSAKPARQIDRRAYMEYAVVDAADVTTPAYLDGVAARVLARRGQRAVKDWLLAGADTVLAEDLMTVDDVAEEVQEGIEGELSELRMLPAETYLHPTDYTDWLQRLWHSAVPWLRDGAATVVSPVRSGATAGQAARVTVSTLMPTDPLDLTVLLLEGGASAAFAQSAAQQISGCRVMFWPDPYRILLLRLRCGIATGQIVRLGRFEHAFRLQPPSRRVQLVSQPALFDHLTPLVDDPPPDPEPSEDGEAETGADGSAEALEDDDDDSEQGHAQLDGTARDGHMAYERADMSLARALDRFESMLPQIDGDVARGLRQALDSARQAAKEAGAALPPLERLVGHLEPLDVSLDSGYRPESVARLIGPADRAELEAARADLDAALAQLGIVPIVPVVGAPCDWAVCEAKDVEPSRTVPEGTVLTVLRRGYRRAGTTGAQHVLRTAWVVVSQVTQE